MGYNLYHDVIKVQIFESATKMKSLLIDAEGNIALEISDVFLQVFICYYWIRYLYLGRCLEQPPWLDFLVLEEWAGT